jgi:hypothetical protein
MELTTSWKNEELKESCREGRHEGELDLVLCLLKRRCADFSASLEKQVRRLSVKRFRAWRKPCWISPRCLIWKSG